MARQPIFQLNEHVLASSSMAATVTSAVIDLSEVIGYAVHSIFTGAPVGSISTQASNDGTNFVEVDAHAVAAAGQYLLNIPRSHYRYIKVSYIRTSGTGTLDTYVSGKNS
jgi:hypothetical protein